MKKIFEPVFAFALVWFAVMMDGGLDGVSPAVETLRTDIDGFLGWFIGEVLLGWL